MIPQNVIISRQKKVLDLLRSPNPQGYTRMQIANCLGIERASICRRVAELRDLGLVRIVKIGLDPITRQRATFLTANEDVMEGLPPMEKPEKTGNLFE